MAATVEMKNSETGETKWFYTVDAKEFLRSPGNTWAMTGQVKRSGWATPSARSRRQYVTPKTQTQAEQIADGIVAGLARMSGGVNALAEAIEVPEPASDAESAGLPPENEVPGDSPMSLSGDASADSVPISSTSVGDFD